MGRINSNLGRYGQTLNKGFSNAARNIERTAIVAGAATVGLVATAVKAAADYQDAFATVRKTIGTDLLQSELAQLEKDFVTLSKKIPVTAVELANIGRVAGQLGIRGVDNINSFVETIATLSRVTDLEVNYASEQLGKLGAIFQLQGEGYEKVGSTLVALGNAAASSESEILDVSRRFAAAGAAAGLAIPDILAFASTVTSLGMLPEAAGSALSRLFNNVSRNIAVANGKAKELAEVLHMPFDALRAEFARDPAAVFTKLFTELNRLYESADPEDRFAAAELLKGIGINNVRDLNAVQQLAQGYKELARQREVANKGWEENNALSAAAEERFKSFASQFQIFQNKLNAVGITVGTALFPALQTFMDKIATFIEVHEQDIINLGEELAQGASQFVAALTPERLEAMADGLRSIVNVVKGIVSGFLSMPEWMRNVLIGGWAANKFTGGAIGDAFAITIKGAFGQFLQRGSSPANPLWVASVGGVGGIGGAGAGGAGGLIGFGRMLLTRVLPGILIGGLIYELIKEPLLDAIRSVTSQPRKVDENGRPIGFRNFAPGGMKTLPAPMGPPAPGPWMSSAEIASITAQVFKTRFGVHSDQAATFGSAELKQFRGSPQGAIDLFDERIKYLAGAQGAGAGSESYLALIQRDIDALNRLLPGATAEQAATIKTEIGILQGILEAKKFEASPELLDAIRSQSDETNQHLEDNRAATLSSGERLAQTIRDKDWRVNVNVNTHVTTKVTVRDVIRTQNYVNKYGFIAS